MNRLLRKITAVVSAAAAVAVGGIVGLSALADGEQTTLDISKGSITITADSVSGYDRSGNEVKVADPDGYIITGSTTSNTVTVSGTQKITLDNASIDVSDNANCTAFKIEDNNTGNVTVTLVGDNTLKSGENCAGLQKDGSQSSTGTLTITGTGTLTAVSGEWGAGIGGGYESDTANITINGCTVNATGQFLGAGIGGGYMGDADNIVIESANVTADGDSGIGTGNQGGNIDGIEIINSTVTATGSSGAGIGGSDDGGLNTLKISGSTVTATSRYASGIGGGKGGSTYWGGKCTNVTIDNSVVIATGGGGAGIGTGNAHSGICDSGDGFSYCKDITITNSVVTAKGSEGSAGIGGGYMGQCENVKIINSSVKAEGNGVPNIGWGKYYEYDGETGENVEYYGKAVNATNGSKTVYLLKIANPAGAEVTIDGAAYAVANHSAADENDTKLYAYLAAGDHIITVGDVTTEYHYIVNAKNELVAVSTDLTITADSGELVYGEDYIYPAETGVLTILSDKAVTISGTTETDTIYVASGVSANITLNGVNIDVSGTGDADNAGKAALEIAKITNGNPIITLAGDNYLKSGAKCAGLQKNGDYVGFSDGILTIESDTENPGKLTAVGGAGGAGIGGSDGESGQNIKITGCEITATGKAGGAGIGGGKGGVGVNIQLENCNVTATGDAGGAGIGGGDGESSAKIYINGSTVTANGSDGGAGIGGGSGGYGSNIIIYDGTVTATAGNYGAGIGGGDGAYGSNIIIYDGTVTATAGDNGAGIGGGDGAYGSNITINSGKVEATGGAGGAGIGGGNGKYGSDITINGGTVTAIGGDGAAGIGGGNGSDSGSDGSGSDITISGGTVTAIGGGAGAGIGGGYGGSGSGISITGGTVTATGGDYGAGIGDGNCTTIDPDSPGSIIISGGAVTATGGEYGAGIGGGSYIPTSIIEISGGSVKAVAGPGAQYAICGNGDEAFTPTDDNGNNVYLFTIANPDSAEVLIDGAPYTPVNHKAVDSNDGNLYAYLPAKTVSDPCVVKVGTKETKYAYDTKWLIVPTVTAPTAKDDLVYNGTAQELISAGSTDFGTLLYSLDDTTYSTSIPTATNAGEYTVYYKVQGDSNVNDVAAEQITATIGKANATVKAKSYTVKFGNPLPTLEYETEGLIGTDTLSSIGVNVTIGYENDVTPSDINIYTIVVSGEAATTNYTLTYNNGTLTIIEKPAQTITANAVTLSYGDAGKKITASTSGDGVISYAVASGDDVISVAEDGTITVLKAGTATVEITAAETFDYAKATKTITVTVNKKKVAVPTADSTVYTYNGKAQTYGVVSTDDYTVSGGTQTGAGNHTVTITLKDENNCEWDGVLGTYTFVIKKAAVTITANSYTIKVGTSLPTFDYKVSGLVNNEKLPIDVKISCTATDSDTDGEYTIEVSGAADSPNYTYTYVNGTLTITLKDIQTITADDVKLTYGDTDKKITATTNGDGVISYEVKTGDDVIRVAADGTITALKAGTATVEITAAETNGYAAATKTVSVTVNKKKVAVPTADSTVYTYNGKAQTYGVVSTADYTVSGGTQTGAGTYPITITLNDENYEWDGVLGTHTFVIKKAAVAITANSYTVIVGKALPTFDYKVSGLVNNEALPITVTISCAATNSDNAGTFPIIVSGADESTNYVFTYANGTLKITAKDVQTITADDVTLTYGDAGKKITAATSGDGAISYAVKTGNDVISVAADGTIKALKSGTATVEITAAETDAYEQATTTVTVTVNKAAVTIKADDKTVYQNAALPAFTYSVTGLVNGDTLAFTPVLTCEATNTSTVGTYAITVAIEITEDECYTYTAQNGTLTVKKKSSGGGGGGGGYRPTTPTEPNNPSIGGSAKSWSDVAADLGKLTNGSEATIELNGNTTVPVDVIKAIADKDIKVTFVIDSVFTWVVDGAEITTPVVADLTLTKTASTKHDGLRGIEGTQFKINGTNLPTDLMIAFKKEHAGKFANLYKVVDGKLVFVTCAKLGEDGKVILPDVTEKGDYVVMLCEFSDRLGDMDNDGFMNAKDASAILKDIVEIEPGKNPLMADFNGDGKVNAMDAAAILKRIVGLA